MRLVLANPHIHQYGKTVSNFITFQKTAIKYTYFLDNYIKNDDRDVAFFIDGTRSSFNEIGIRFKYLPRIFAYLELLLWMIINQVNPFKHKVYFDIKKLDPQNDIVFNCSFTTIDNYARNNNGMQFHHYDGIIITHLTHYFCDAKAISHYLKNIKNSFLVAENDLSKNDFFSTLFSGYKECLSIAICLFSKVY